MVESEAKHGTCGLLFGSGPRAQEVAAVLATLSGLAAAGARPPDPALVPAALEDLEELLRERPGEGVLILESSRVPAEDIGFVRRFLERQPGWSLVVLCDDDQTPPARDLAGLARSRLLAWPPDLEALRALLTPPARLERREAPPERRGLANGRARRAGPAPPSGELDLGALLEEVLASAALRGEGAPRYHFRCDVPVLIEREREPLAEGLSGLLELARRCAGAEGLVRTAVIPGAQGPRIGLEFPLGELPQKDLPRFLEGPFPADADPGLLQGLVAAQQGAALLRGLGARVEFGVQDALVRCEVHLVRPGEASRPAAGAAGRAAGRGGKPEDPFA